jgi:hypothetical protein
VRTNRSVARESMQMQVQVQVQQVKYPSMYRASHLPPAEHLHAPPLCLPRARTLETAFPRRTSEPLETRVRVRHVV